MNYVYRIKIITSRTKNHWNGIGVGEMAEFDSCVSWSFEDEYDYDSQPQSSTDSFPNYECCLFTLHVHGVCACCLCTLLAHAACPR